MRRARLSLDRQSNRTRGASIGRYQTINITDRNCFGPRGGHPSTHIVGHIPPLIVIPSMRAWKIFSYPIT
jgi:hypothetical protein